jgi:hypothetical protein
MSIRLLITLLSILPKLQGLYQTVNYPATESRASYSAESAVVDFLRPPLPRLTSGQ